MPRSASTTSSSSRDWLARHDGVARFALAREVAVWTVPPDIVDAISIVGRLTTGPPTRVAAALARLPLAPALAPSNRTVWVLDLGINRPPLSAEFRDWVEVQNGRRTQNERPTAVQ